MSDDKFYGGLRVGAAGGGGGSVAPGAGFLRDWYLSPTGNDNANGSISAPWLTLARVQAEFNKYSRGTLSMVRLYAAAGTYTACSFDGSAFALGGRFVIQALTTTTLLAGTIVAGSTVSVMNTSALGGTNNYSRKWMRRRDQTGVLLDERQIGQNTATTITPTVSFLSVPATTDTFEIYEPAFVIDGSAAMYSFSNFPGMNSSSQRSFITPADPLGAGGGVYMADVRWIGSSVALYLRNTFLYTKTLQLTGATGLFNVTVQLDAVSGWGCGINAPGFAVTATQFLSTFMNVANDDMWFGCGVAAEPLNQYTLRINGGSWFGYVCGNSLYLNLSIVDTAAPNAVLLGGFLDAPIAWSQALICGYGVNAVRNPQLSPYNPMQISEAGNFPAVSMTGGSSASGIFNLAYANILNTFAGAVDCVRADAGAVIAITSTCIGNSTSGFGIQARNGGVIQLNGALNIGGAAGDSRVDGANIQAKAFYSAAGIANPAAPLADGSKIYRGS
jgi:hypothetical protein